jgi:methylglutamate dehydrogenase subunit D
MFKSGLRLRVSSTQKDKNFVLEGIKKVQRSAFLEAVEVAHQESDHGGFSVTVTERANINVIEISAFRGKQPMLTQVLRQCNQIELPASCSRSVGRDCAILWNGPNRWIFETVRKADVEQLKSDLQGIAAVLDQTDGRCLLRIHGSHAERVLQKGLKIDIHRNIFKKDAVALTVIEEIEAHICRHVDEPACFDVTINRSVAASFWRWLSVGSEEYGLAVAR